MLVIFTIYGKLTLEVNKGVVEMSNEKNQVKNKETLEALKSDYPLTNLLQLFKQIKQTREKQLALVKIIVNEHKPKNEWIRKNETD